MLKLGGFLRSILLALIVLAQGANAQLVGSKVLASDAGFKDQFGRAMDVSGDYAIIGSPRDGDMPRSSGSAYIFHFDGNAWNEQVKLVPSDGVEGGLFGFWVSIDGDFALIGAYGDTEKGTLAGAAYVFHREGDTWVEQVKLTASDGSEFDRFGRSLSIRGSRALIGAYKDDSVADIGGSAYIFEYDGADWNEIVKLTAAQPDSNDRFGRHVVMGDDYAMIGAWRDDDTGTESGAVYAYKEENGQWVLEDKLIPADSRSQLLFGGSIDITDGWMIVGAIGDSSQGFRTGAVYMYKLEQNGWVEAAKILPEIGGTMDDFGTYAAISGDYALVGSHPFDKQAGPDGYAILYHHDGQSWNQQEIVYSSEQVVDDFFGFCVALDGNHALVGAYNDDDLGEASGSAYAYTGFITEQVSAAVSIDTSYLPVPPEGEVIQYELVIDNLGADASDVAFWIELTNPQDRVATVLPARQMVFEPGESLSRTAALNIRATQPPGLFDLIVYWVDQTHAATDTLSSTFTFEKNAAAGSAQLETLLPRQTLLSRNYPNPFNPTTTIRYTLPVEGEISLIVYDLLGRQIRQLASGSRQEAGYYSVVWDGTGDAGEQVASGIYFYRLTVYPASRTPHSAVDITRKMLLSR